MPEKKDMHRLSQEDLAEELKTAREDLLELRMQLATRQLKNVREIPRARRRIARALTVMREREIESA